VKEKDPNETPKTVIPQKYYKNQIEVKTLKATLKKSKQHTCEAKLQGLPNLIRKKNE
jgi:hypothetical protein